MILPAHPKPYPDELLTSWLIRLAHANGLKVQTFYHLLFPDYEIWNRDIDRHAPDWLIHALTEKTGCPIAQIHETTLDSLKGKLFEYNRISSQLAWISSLKANHRKRDNNAIEMPCRRPRIVFSQIMARSFAHLLPQTSNHVTRLLP